MCGLKLSDGISLSLLGSGLRFFEGITELSSKVEELETAHEAAIANLKAEHESAIGEISASHAEKAQFESSQESA
jgi:hypothetical protein